LRNPVEYLRTTAFRIALAYAGLFAASVVVLFAGLYWSVTHELQDAIEDEIARDVSELERGYELGGTGELVSLVRRRIEASRGSGGLYLVESSGQAAHSANMPLLSPFTGWHTIELDDDDYDDDDGFEVDDIGEQALLFGLRLGSDRLIVGRGLTEVEETTELLFGALIWTLSLTVFLALAGGLVFSRAAVRRVAVISRTTDAIVAGDMTNRIPIEGRDDELSRLAHNINRMLDRNEALMTGLRQVSDDIAHDLRTPLGRLRQKLERAYRQESTVAGCKTALVEALTETDGILETFAALLRIAQIEAGARKSRFTRIDLSGLASAIVEAYEEVAKTDGHILAAQIEPGIEIEGDRDLLSQALANLVENAIRHAPSGSDIALDLRREGKGTVLSVGDHGPGIPEAERANVLKRFYRLEQSRTSPGSGLGLALVKAIAELHDSKLSLSDNRPGLLVGLRFQIAEK
jgi:signal transduction histidine kinase